jgi:hypothetical protein
MVRRDKDSKRVEGRNSPFQGPSGSHRIHVGCYLHSIINYGIIFWGNSSNRKKIFTL